MNKNDPVVIIGAGPAGLTAARELQRAGCMNVTVLEADQQVGGISRTVNYKGNRIDIGGHRFFSKSDWVMKWWAQVLPVSVAPGADMGHLQYRGMSRQELPDLTSAEPDGEDGDVMLLRDRLSRIYYNKQFFDYPLKLNLASLRKLGVQKTVSFGVSYAWAKLRPIRNEKSLEDFLINRFGHRLYRQFFKEYTEKVWGVPCHEISAEWGAQRIKSLSIWSAVWHALRDLLGLGQGQVAQTSLIEKFIYPKLGPGQMWEAVAREFVAAGGHLYMGYRANQLVLRNGRVSVVKATSTEGQTLMLPCANVISTMPIKELVESLPTDWAPQAAQVARNLQYRDFITVGLLYDAPSLTVPLKDNWIYIQEPGVQVGRVQVFNNWSPYMVARPETVWMGLEFFCKESDPLWQMSDEDLKRLAQSEMHQIGLTAVPAALDAVVIRVPKAYPGYFGSAYAQFDDLRAELDAIENLFLVGRNGMHRYNNQDHSMLTAKRAVELILEGRHDKQSIWDINVDDEYHEEARESSNQPS
ncbi:NAD(P)/FAD-dependent oxidoreductase [Curvibacter gracilis]|uniref:NAD(P)/FAD-dependent oxidoreductase n=1 Tax=Curvibacter gracilis TaxID=230310 RepID=UPI0005BD5BAC|nr:NAD(P)/FAD-dependent oxidoreductase [Curvibacter gracilis]